jgi:Zn-dependent M28 family amino/carboxypeptidase
MSQPTKARLRAAAVLAVVATFMVALSLPSAGGAAPPGCDNRTNNTYAKLLDCVTLEGVRAHQAAFQRIANANDDPFAVGSRAAGTDGYTESVEYVADLLEDAGYEVTLDDFPYTFTGAVLEQTAPVTARYETGAFTNSGTGDVTGNVIAVDINLAPPRATTSGCDGAFTEAAVGAPIVPDPGGPDDFAGFVSGSIALIQRGGCSFALKAYNAQAAGAGGVIIFNQGDTPARSGLIVGNATAPPPAPFVLTVPVVGASFAAGEALAQPGSAASINVPAPENITLNNVIAESKSGNANNVVMAGAHLDSVAAGPGINDNGSGSAALLETAEQMAKVKPWNKVRFAWWGAEEAGLVGSTAYVNDLSQAQRDKITLYLNFDMVGSPNHVFFIYDGDDSDNEGAPAGPPGSAQIEKTFERYFDSVSEPFKGTDFSGRSDYGPFIAVGIPSGGLFTGAEGIKTAAEAAIWGGTAGQQYDPCYHLACDTFANNNDHALDVNSDAIAYATLQYAMNTSDINGVRAKGNFKVPPFQPVQ